MVTAALSDPFDVVNVQDRLAAVGDTGWLTPARGSHRGPGRALTRPAEGQESEIRLCTLSMTRPAWIRLAYVNAYDNTSGGADQPHF
ncbi:hypothetical protein [Streptomyces sp. NPDC101165]|uniref:hypothetical protein n=1 Tax=Streptomyces sp. NPDC101165 TaxID=3366119 RepID=UPI00382D3D48